MTLSIKLTDEGSIITIYSPKQRVYVTRPLHLSELNLLYEYGEEVGLNMLENKIFIRKEYE